MSDPRLAARTVLITGAGGGLGSAVARACARDGATAVLLGRSINKLEVVYDAIMAAGSPQPAIYPFDLAGASEKDYADLAVVLEREFGALHGLVHCAAELGTLGPLADVSRRVWEWLLQVNLTAPFLLTRELLPLLLRAEAGAVLFTGDSAVDAGNAYWGAYGVAKLGLAGYARILAEETAGRGLKVEVFTPGPMHSPIRRRAYPGEDPEPLPTPETLAESVVDRLSPAA